MKKIFIKRNQRKKYRTRRGNKKIYPISPQKGGNYNSFLFFFLPPPFLLIYRVKGVKGAKKAVSCFFSGARVEGNAAALGVNFPR